MDTDGTRGKADPCACYKLCKDSTKAFEKVVDLKNAGIVIYRHTVKMEDVNDDSRTVVGAPGITEEVFILQNTKDTIITAETFLNEIEKREITCARCRKIMEHTLKLLQNVPAINRKDITVICDHCTLNKQPCNCEKIIKKFFVRQSEVEGNTKKRIKEWLSKIKNAWADSFVGVKETAKYPKRSQSELRIDQLCRRTKLRTERDPDIRQLFDDNKRSRSAKTLPIVNEESKKQIDFLSHHPQLESEDRPSMFVDLSGTKTYISDKDQSSFNSTDYNAEKKLQQMRDHFINDDRIFERTLFPKSRPQNREYSMDDILLEGSSRQYDTQSTERDKAFTQKVTGERHTPEKEREGKKYLEVDQSGRPGEEQLAQDSLKPKTQYTSARDGIPKKLLGKLAATSDVIKEKTTSGSKNLIKVTEKGRFAAKEKKHEGEKKQIHTENKNKEKSVTTSFAMESTRKEFKQKESKADSKEPIPKANESKFISKETKLRKKEPTFEPKEPKLVSKQTKAKIQPKSVLKESKSEKPTETKFGSKETKPEIKEPKSVNKNTSKAEYDTIQERSGKKIKENENASKGNKESDKEIRLRDKQKTINAEKVEIQKRKEGHVKGNGAKPEKLTEKEKKEREEQGHENTLRLKKSAEQDKNEKEKNEEMPTQKRNLREKESEKKVKDKLYEKEAILKTENIYNQKGEQLDVKVDTDNRASKISSLKKKKGLGEVDVEESKIPSKYKSPQLGYNYDNKNTTQDLQDPQVHKRLQDSQNIEKKAQDTDELNIPLNKIKIQQDEPNRHGQIKGQPILKELPEKSNLNSLLKDGLRKAKEENALKREIAQAEKESQSPEKKTKQKNIYSDVKKKMEITKKREITKFQMLRPSQDDLISNLLRLKQEGKTFKGRLSDIMTPFEIECHKNEHRIIKGVTCPMCIDSNLELQYASRKKKAFEVFEIVRGQKIYKLRSQIVEKSIEDEVPLFFHSKYDERAFDTIKAAELAENLLPPQTGETAKNLANQGVIRYALSDRTFIDKGWTMLPTEKVVRKMNVYRMRPVQPEFDWFKRNKNKGLMLYDSGERLAEVEVNGCGRWYYRNGRMALDYYNAEECNAQQRYVIYSNGEPDQRGRSRPYTILATFDYLGNGIVFDHSGKIRLKYNQTEGVVLDRNIGPVSHWKWHTLNDPPVLQQVMIDTQLLHKDPDILSMGGKGDASPTRPEDEEMLAIEFDNFIKEKSKKLSQSFKPFQIRTKALKINEHFSLKIMDQATIYLIYRDGTTNLKLNIGMLLDHKEIVDTDTAELGEVANNIERYPARSDSLAGLQKSIAYAEHFERTRTERERRLYPLQPNASVDKLTAAASRPMRHQMHFAPSSTMTGTTSSSSKYSRKPISNNVYYDARLI